MRLWVSAIVLAALASLVACDPIYGINRQAKLSSLPELDCVEAAIRSVPEVISVRRWDDEGGRPLTWTGIQRPDELHYFQYEIATSGATLMLCIDYAGKVEMSQSRTSIGTRIPPEECHAVRPVMLQIEKALQEHCGVEPFKVHEYWSRSSR